MIKVEHKFINRVEVKWCNHCKDWIDLRNFGIRTSSWDKIAGRCLSCSKDYYKEKPGPYLERGRRQLVETPKLCSLRNSKRTAKRRKIPFLLTDEEYYFLIKQNCVYCDAIPSLINGVDRRDNNHQIGYTRENSVSCCNDCNSSKRTYSIPKFLSSVFHIAQYQEENSFSQYKLGIGEFSGCYLHALNCIFGNYRRMARNRNLTFQLEKDFVFSLVKQNCAYCGKKPSNIWKISVKGKLYGFEPYSGIDRINNDIGYLPNNVVPCCFECNQMKRKRTTTDFLSWVEKITLYQEKKGKIKC